MPIETEDRFILDVPNPSALLDDLERQWRGTVLEISQGYLNGARLRRTRPWHSGTEKHEFGYKQDVDGQVVEIETPISEADYRLLWTKVDRIVKKTRVVVEDRDYKWDVDFLRDPANDEIYMVRVEVEHDAAEAPETLPTFVRDFLLHAAARDDDRFSNKNLANVATARRLLDELRAAA